MKRAIARDFYDTTYHFDEDIERPNVSRLWNALKELEPLENTAFLDVGCGAGLATRLALLEGGARIAAGLDFSIRALTLARTHTPQALWVSADGSALPIRSASLDRVFSFGSMEHFPNVELGFREVFRILRPGGLAVTVVPNFYVHTGQPLEFRASYSGWRGVIEASGLRVLRVGTDRGPAILKNRRPARVLLRLGLRILSFVPPLRYQFIFVLCKPSS